MSDAPKKVIFEVLRYNPGVDAKPRMQSYEVPSPKGLTVLDGLLWIKENLYPTLSWRSSCRMGVCGSCAMFINGKPRLACANQVAHLGGGKVVVKPLPNYDIIRDLVPDLEPFFAKHAAIKPFLIRKNVEELESPTGEFFQSKEELINYIQFAYCIKCGACLAACPTVATDESFLGPQALAQAWRYTSDSRDEGAAERGEEVFTAHGAFRCHFAGACSDVCPKGVDPAFAIQLMKQFMFRQKLGGCKDKHASEVAPPVENWTPREGIPKPPEHSV